MNSATKVEDAPHARLRETLVLIQQDGWQRHIETADWFFTSVLHDLRNPLGAIYAGAEMLMDLDRESSQVKRLAGNIYRAAGRMQQLLADLTSSHGGNKAVVEICDIRGVIAAAWESAVLAAEAQSVQVLLELPGEIEVPAARSRIESVFFNLISNSLEAMSDGGKVRIRAVKAGKSVLIEVEDSGPGIPSAIRDRLFEPFVTAGKQNGLGLGLALSRMIVLDHGGDLWSEPAAGARFVIRLPLFR